MQLHDCFSSRYEEARAKFRLAAENVGDVPTPFAHPTRRGAEDEELAMDVAWIGPRDARHLILVTSAMHGAEGFCGSGAQIALLHDAALLQQCAKAGAALLLVHAVNPYGFSHMRRVNEDNVDLNRNFMDFTRPLPQNPAYAEVAPLLLPAHWPPSEQDEAALARAIAERGMSWYQAAVSAGQYDDPHGMFYGGRVATWSNYTLRRILARYGAGRTSLRWIDIHTGLGPWGYGEPIYMGPDDAPQLERTRAIWGQHVTSMYDGSSSSANLTGLAWHAVPDTLPNIDFAGIALEFGTLPLPDVLQALRGDHWLHLHPDADNTQRALIRQGMWRAFYGDADDWREGVVEQCTTAVRAAVAALGALAEG